MEIADNGIGFDFATYLNENNDLNTGLGLRSIKGRAKVIGADFHIESNPGNGIIRISLPLK